MFSRAQGEKSLGGRNHRARGFRIEARVFREKSAVDGGGALKS
jgi:hypothetical protein